MNEDFRHLVILFALMVLFCAHKGPPLHIDRINPKIIKATAINEHLVNLLFSEDLDTMSMKSENFVIQKELETLKVLTAFPGNTPDQIFLSTDKMELTDYTINGKVYDKSGREGYFKTKFFGTTKSDTIRPWIVNYSKGYRLKSFYVEFSEPVDTLSIKYYCFPKKKMYTKWRYMKNLHLSPLDDSLNYDTTYYLYLKGIKDLSGNYAIPFITTITPDTIYNPVYIRGKATINDTNISKAIALIEREKILGISIVENGEFLFEVRDSLKYFIQIFGENLYGTDSISASQLNIIRLVPGVFNLDSIIN